MFRLVLQLLNTERDQAKEKLIRKRRKINVELEGGNSSREQLHMAIQTKAR